MTRRQSWAWAAVALGSAVALVLAYWNAFSFVFLRDHPVPLLIFWPVLWILLAVAVTLLIPSWSRTGPAIAAVFAGTAVVVLVGGAFRLVIAMLLSTSAGHGELVDHATSADGRYEVRVLRWQSVIGEDGWDVVVHRQDGWQYTETFGGCLFSESSGAYTGIEAVEAGSVRIATGNGPVSLTFDPATLQVTRRIPADLCAGYD